jgi:Cu+-exporting ATPase
MTETISKKINIEKLSLPVEGMTCASCVARVEKTLSGINGVSEIAVNLATEKATFSINRDIVEIDELKKVMEEAGYKIIVSSLIDDQSSGDNVEYVNPSDYDLKLKKDFLFALVLTVPIFILSMSQMLTGFNNAIPLTLYQLNYILFILAAPVVFISGKRFYKIFWDNLKHFTADMNSLVAVGTGAAFSFSALVTLFPELIIKEGEIPHVYFDTTVVIITLILLGKWLESRAKTKTSSAIKKLIALKPKTALIKTPDGEKIIDINELKQGNVVIVKPGEKVPADGIILFGTSAVDEAMITGESFPVEKTISDKVVGGTINKTGSFEFKVSAVGKESVLGKIITLVEEAQGSKAPIQRLADKVAAVFVPIVIAIAIITFMVWIILGGENSFTTALVNFVAVLIIACPCAMGLATPTALIVGIGKGAENGILIKNGVHLELTHKLNTILFDKTGTITEGNPVVSKIITKDMNEEDLLQIGASLESRSEHPIANAIVEYARSKKIQLLIPEEFKSKTGLGISGKINGSKIIIGNQKYLHEENILNNKFEKEGAELSDEGKSIVYISVNGSFVGLIAIADPVKESSHEAIDSLRNLKIKTILITGDNIISAKSVAQSLKIDEVESEVLPDQKSKTVLKYQERGDIVGMVGDGINDAPALAQADVGLAIGTGTDVAIDTGDIVLMKGDLMGVVKAIKLSKATIRAIKQNLFWAFIYNTLGIPLAALGLLNPMFAALAMSISSVSVISNSLRLKKLKLR